MKKDENIKKEERAAGFLFILMLLCFAVSAFAVQNNIRTIPRGKKYVLSKKKSETTGKVASKNNFPANRRANNSKSKGKIYRAMSSAEIRKRFLMDKPYALFTEAEKQKVRRELKALRDRKTTQQFLTIIQIAEAGEPNIMVGDKPGCRVKNLRKHPALVLPNRCYYFYYNKKGKLVYSTASGNYQLTLTNYKRLAPFLVVSDFEIPSQQLLALGLIRDGGRNPAKGKTGFEALVRGNVPKAVKLATSDWAAFPTSDLEGRKRENVEQIVEGVMNGSIKPKTRFSPLPGKMNKTKTADNRQRRKNKKGL